MNAPMGMDKYKLSEEDLMRIMMQMGMVPSTGRGGVRFGQRPQMGGQLPPSARLRVGPTGGGGGSVKFSNKPSNPQPKHTVKGTEGGGGGVVTADDYGLVVDPETGEMIYIKDFRKKYGSTEYSFNV